MSDWCIAAWFLWRVISLVRWDPSMMLWKWSTSSDMSGAQEQNLHWVFDWFMTVFLSTDSWTVTDSLTVRPFMSVMGSLIAKQWCAFYLDKRKKCLWTKLGSFHVFFPKRECWLLHFPELFLKLKQQCPFLTMVFFLKPLLLGYLLQNFNEGFDLFLEPK